MVRHLLAVIYAIIPALTTVLSSEKLSYGCLPLWTGNIPTASHFTSAPVINMIFIMLALFEVTKTQTTCQNCHLKFQQFSSKSLRQLSLLCQRELSFISNGNGSSVDKWWYGQCTLGVHRNEYTYLTYHLFPPLFYTLYSFLPGCFICSLHTVQIFHLLSWHRWCLEQLWTLISIKLQLFHHFRISRIPICSMKHPAISWIFWVFFPTLQHHSFFLYKFDLH